MSFSQALNYAWSGIDPWSYRTVNLALHIANALLLFAVVRRTLEKLDAADLKSSASTLAMCSALLWLAHPLASQCINYAIQRTELLMACCYLAALYAIVRGLVGQYARMWQGGALLACVLGMASKEVMVSAPVMLLLYDGIFGAGSLSAAWSRRRSCYLALAATWIVLVSLLWTKPHGDTVGGVYGAEAWNYALNQSGILLEYVRLAFWPDQLVLDYGFPQLLEIGDVWLETAVVVLLLAATIFALRHWPCYGFLGAWFFVLLAPTSSFVPLLNEVGAERRFYLSLAALIVLVVVGIYHLLWRWLGQAAVRLGGMIALVVLLLLGNSTIERNRDYRSPLAIWRTVVKARPDNPRGHNNLGKAYYEANALDSARVHFRAAVALKPHYPDAWGNLGLVNHHMGDRRGAVEAYNKALRQSPRLAATWYNLGLVHQRNGDLQRAIKAYVQAVEIRPSDVATWYNLGLVHKQARELESALAAFAAVNRLVPDFADGWLETGRVRQRLGQIDDAVRAFERALALRPGDGAARTALGKIAVERP